MWCSGLQVKLRLHNRYIGRFEKFLVSQRTVCELASIFCVQFVNISSIRCGNVYIAANVVRFDTWSFKSRICRFTYRQNHWITQNVRLIFYLWYNTGLLWVDWQVFRVISVHYLVLFTVVYVHRKYGFNEAKYNPLYDSYGDTNGKSTNWVRLVKLLMLKHRN
jgi:hypothetical protein